MAGGGIRMRRTFILAGIEDLVAGNLAYGNTAVPTMTNLTGADAVSVSNVKIDPLKAEFKSRDQVRSFMGGSRKIMTSPSVSMEFDVELVGRGTLGAAPAWGELIRMCAFAETITAGTKVAYTLVDDDHEYGTIWFYHDRKLHKVKGVRGNVKFSLNANNIPMMTFQLTGLYVRPIDIAAASMPASTYTAFKTPLPVNAVNTEVRYGGVTLNASQFEIDAGNEVRYKNNTSEESVRIVDHQSKGKVTFEATYAAEKDWFAHMEAQTTGNLVITHGPAGNQIKVTGESMTLSNLAETTVDGILYYSADFDLEPVTAGDDLVLEIL